MLIHIHFGMRGIEIADEFARKGSRKDTSGYEASHWGHSTAFQIVDKGEFQEHCCR